MLVISTSLMLHIYRMTWRGVSPHHIIMGPQRSSISNPRIESLRVLFLASYFPKPTNPLMGTWALQQAQAFARAGMDVEVVSLTSWVPKVFAWSSAAKGFSQCPPEHRWGDLRVHYPRWLLYQVGNAKQVMHRHPAAPMRIAWESAAPWLRTHVVRRRPDVIYAHHSAVNGYVAHRLSRETGVPYVVTDHSFEDITDCERLPARRAFLEPITRRAHLTIAVSRRMERDIRRVFPEARTTTVHNGVDPIPAHATSAPRPPELRGKTIVFSAGFFYERKQFPLLIRVFGEVAKRHPNAVLRIAGDGPLRASIERAIAQSGAATRIHLLGAIPHSQVLQELAWCDLFALIGRDEPLGSVFIEAAASARPILLANDGGFNDVFQSGAHGFSIPPSDAGAATLALDSLLASDSLRSEMGNAAQHLWGSRLTWDAHADAMGEIFTAARHS